VGKFLKLPLVHDNCSKKVVAGEEREVFLKKEFAFVLVFRFRLRLFSRSVKFHLKSS
jgi:hypothetical protein